MRGQRALLALAALCCCLSVGFACREAAAYRPPAVVYPPGYYPPPYPAYPVYPPPVYARPPYPYPDRHYRPPGPWGGV